MKVGIYCRLIDEDRNKTNNFDESESIQNQRTLLLDYVHNKGWHVYKIYCDEDFSGTDRDRPDFNLLLSDAEKRKFEVILCKSQSRFTREIEIVERYINHKFILWGIRFISIVDCADTNVLENKKSRQIHGLINEWMSEDNSKNIKIILVNKHKNGLFVGPSTIFGYLRDPENKNRLIIDEFAQEIVKKIFRLYLSDFGITKITKILNFENIITPSVYKKNKLKNYNYKISNLWNFQSVTNILKNEIYTGTMVQGKTEKISYKSKKVIVKNKEEWARVENIHEAIIKKEDFERVQEIISKKIKPLKTGKINIFKSKANCIYCKNIMKISLSNNKRYLVIIKDIYCVTQELF